MYNDKVIPSKTEIENMFATPLSTLLKLSALANSPDTDSDTDERVRLANGDIADQLVLILRQFDRMGFVDIIDDENSERVDSERGHSHIDSGKPKLVISLSGIGVAESELA